MWHMLIISSGIISIISVCILYILNKDNVEKQIDYKYTFATIMTVSLLILSFSQSNTEQLVTNISSNMTSGANSVHKKVPF